MIANLADALVVIGEQKREIEKLRGSEMETDIRDKAIEEVFDLLGDMHDGEECWFENSEESGCLACKCQEILLQEGVRRFKNDTM